MSEPNIIALGLDNGNGTVICSARNNGVVYESYFPAVHNTGDKRINLKGEEIGVPINPDYNGGFRGRYVDGDGVEHDDDFTIKVAEDGVAKDYYIGQAAYMVDGVPKRNIGPGRLGNTKFMRIMIYAAIKSLLKQGMYWDKNGANVIHLCAGLPPEWYYNNKGRKKAFEDNYKKIITGPYKIYDSKFVFEKPFIFMGEGLGAYYDYIFDDRHNPQNGIDTSDGVLIIDAGQSTLDTAIITGGVMRKEDIITNPQYGMQSFYNEVVSELSLRGVNDVKATDVEQYHYTRTTHVSRLDNVFDDAFSAALSEYFDKFVSYINQIYSSRTNQFASALLVGGIMKACEGCNNNLISDLQIALDGTEVNYSGDKSNASGYRKGIEGALIQNGIIEKNWG